MDVILFSFLPLFQNILALLHFRSYTYVYQEFVLHSCYGYLTVTVAGTDEDTRHSACHYSEVGGNAITCSCTILGMDDTEPDIRIFIKQNSPLLSSLIIRVVPSASHYLR
jgi:hypothetical protein